MSLKIKKKKLKKPNQTKKPVKYYLKIKVILKKIVSSIGVLKCYLEVNEDFLLIGCWIRTVYGSHIMPLLQINN